MLGAVFGAEVTLIEAELTLTAVTSRHGGLVEEAPRFRARVHEMAGEAGRALAARVASGDGPRAELAG
jgi:hypothetical protein